MERQRRDELIGGPERAGSVFGRWFGAVRPTDGDRLLKSGYFVFSVMNLGLFTLVNVILIALIGFSLWHIGGPAAAFDLATLLLGAMAAVAAMALVAAVAAALGVRRQRRVNAGLQREVADHLGAADDAMRALQVAGQQPARGGDMALSAAIDRAVIAARLRAVDRYLRSGWAAPERHQDQPSGGSAKPAA